MARAYRLGAVRRVAKLFSASSLRAGIGPGNAYLLTTRGRRTGKRRTTPVQLIERDGVRYLVAPYGTVGWVHNARAAGEVTLRRGRRSSLHTVEEVAGAEAGPVLRQYARQVPITRPYFDAAKDAPVAEFEAEASRHPVFRLGPAR